MGPHRLLGAAAIIVALTAGPTIVAGAGPDNHQGRPATGSSIAAKLTISKTKNLADGEQILVSGVGFAPHLTGISIGECYRDTCSVQGGVQVVTADARGNFGPVQLIMRMSFGSIDCTKVSCVIIAAPAAAPADIVRANTVVLPITFDPTAKASPVPVEPAVLPLASTPASTRAEGAKTSPSPASASAGDALPYLAAGLVGLILLAAAVVVLVTLRRAGGVRAG